MLRDRYRLKLETSARGAIIQWTLIDGEIPSGLRVGTNGTITGKPEGTREQAYRFRLKVIDVSANDDLILDFSLAVKAARLRLTRIEGPRLVPVEGPPQLANDEIANGNATAAAARTSGPTNPFTDGRNVPTDIASTSIAAIKLPGPAPKRGMISRFFDVFGLGQRDSGTERRDQPGVAMPCSSARNTVISDEAHNPLEGDTATQPTCVKFINLNTLKYRIDFNEKKTTSAGPDISSLPFIPKITPTTQSAIPAAANVKPSSSSAGVTRLMDVNKFKEPRAIDEVTSDLQVLNRNFTQARDALTTSEKLLRSTEDEINSRVAQVQGAQKESVRLANSADFYLQSNNTSALLTDLSAATTFVNEAMKKTSPSEQIRTVLESLDLTMTKLEDLRVKDNGDIVVQDIWAEWLAANQDRYNRVRDRINELKTKVNTIDGGAAAFNESKNVLAGWQLIINNAHNQGESAFRQEAFVSCHNDEAESQSSKLSIAKTDRTVANATASTRDVLTANCYSRIAITAGFNFSTLDEKEFSVVQAAGPTPGTVVKKFGFTSSSSFRPNPLVLVNFRFTDRPKYNWYASFGSVVDVKGQTGTDIEPVVGVSVALRRFFFITPFAVHFGRVPRLAGGFKVGDLVPDSVATPPIEKSWKIGYTAGVTFKITP